MEMGVINKFLENEDTWRLSSGYSEVNRSEPNNKHRGDIAQGWSAWKIDYMHPCLKAWENGQALPMVMELGWGNI